MKKETQETLERLTREDVDMLWLSTIFQIGLILSLTTLASGIPWLYYSLIFTFAFLSMASLWRKTYVELKIKQLKNDDS